MYTENYKILMKEIKTQISEKIRIKKVNILKISILTKVIYSLNVIPMSFSTKIEQFKMCVKLEDSNWPKKF